MKKLVFFLMTLFAVSFYSCGTAETAEVTNDSIDTTSVDSVIDSIVVDSASIDTTRCTC